MMVLAAFLLPSLRVDTMRLPRALHLCLTMIVALATISRRSLRRRAAMLGSISQLVLLAWLSVVLPVLSLDMSLVRDFFYFDWAALFFHNANYSFKATTRTNQISKKLTSRAVRMNRRLKRLMSPITVIDGAW
jgi:hypothetical protein